MQSIYDDEYFMGEALKEARIAYAEGEVPVGAIVVCHGHIVARAHNMAERLNDATAHAEMLALTAASEHLGSKFLEECTLYVSLEPCMMCSGATYWARIGRLVYGAADPKRGYSRHFPPPLHPKTVVLRGVLEAEAADLLKTFFDARRRK